MNYHATTTILQPPLDIVEQCQNITYWYCVLNFMQTLYFIHSHIGIGEINCWIQTAIELSKLTTERFPCYKGTWICISLL